MKTKKRFLGILLSLALVLGVMPGMSMTAYAADTPITWDSSALNSINLREVNNSYTNSGITVTMTAMEAGGFYGKGIKSGGPATFVFSSTVGNIKGIVITAERVNYHNNDWSIGSSRDTLKWSGTPASTVSLSSNSISIREISSIVFTIGSAGKSVTITPGDNMTKTTDSGAASQTDLSGAMTAVVYTANDGYYFPTDYSVTAVNGISVTRNSHTQITVSGTPTADAAISLPAPTAKTKPDALTTAAAVNCTTADNNDGKLTGVTTAMEYKKSDADSWTDGTGSDITGLAPGTYYVRIKATDTTLASDNQTLTIAGYTAPTYTVTYKVIHGTWSDDSTADKTENVQSGSKPASVPTGMKASEGYTGGAWDIDPAEKDITEAATFTYTFTAKQTATVTKAPTAKTLTYNGQAQELVTAGEVEGGEMQYALGTDATTAPTTGYTTSIPTKTNAGTYYVWYKAVGNDGYTGTEPECITVTIKEASSAPSVPMIVPYTPVPAPAATSAPAAVSTAAPVTAATPARAAEAYTVPVSNENTVDISVNISDGNAVVQEITQADLNKITETSAETGNGGDNKADDNKISIDVSGAKSEVTSVELSSTSIETLAKTVEASEKVDSVEIKMTNATVELDGAAVSAISGQKEGNTVKLVVENKEQAKLNETQKEALKNFTSVQPFQAYFESAGKEIHDFKGGKAMVSIKFTPETGKDVKHYHMYYVPLDGLIERYVTRYLNGMLTFVTTHFSDYAIVYDETVENETGKEDTTASPVPSETAIPAATATAPAAEPAGQPGATATPAPAVSAEEKATAALDLNAGLKVIHKGKTATVQWGEVDGADFYRVYAGYCGGKVSLVKTVKSGAKCKVTIRSLNGKKLNTTKNIKVYVAAYRKAAVTGGTGTVTKNVQIAKTITGHVVGKSNTKYSNAKKITLEKSSCTLKKGKKAQIKATTVLEYPERKPLSDAHAKEFRYATSDKSIAAVSKTGKITAKKKGNCVIYVYARNGLAKKIKVTVR